MHTNFTPGGSSKMAPSSLVFPVRNTTISLPVRDHAPYLISTVMCNLKVLKDAAIVVSLTVSHFFPISTRFNAYGFGLCTYNKRITPVQSIDV